MAKKKTDTKRVIAHLSPSEWAALDKEHHGMAMVAYKEVEVSKKVEKRLNPDERVSPNEFHRIWMSIPYDRENSWSRVAKKFQEYFTEYRKLAISESRYDNTIANISRWMGQRSKALRSRGMLLLPHEKKDGRTDRTNAAQKAEIEHLNKIVKENPDISSAVMKRMEEETKMLKKERDEAREAKKKRR